VRQHAILFAAGAVLGTALDGVHVATGTTRYAQPALLGIAWWAPILFGGAAVAIGGAHALIDLLLERSVRPDAGRVAFGLVLLLVLWTVSGVVKPASTALWILAPASLAMWWAFDASVVGLVLALATASSGVAVEATLVSAGAFAYVAPDAGRVASWLPWLYVAASVAVGNLARWLAPTRAPSPGSRQAR
jgi:hypothetical protein